MDMQDKIMKAIRKIVEDAGLDYVVRTGWSNTGDVYVQEKGEFVTKFAFHYNFDHSRFTMQFYPGSMEPVGTIGFTHEKCFSHTYLAYTDALEINQLLGNVTNWCRPKATLPAAVGRRR